MAKPVVNEHPMHTEKLWRFVKVQVFDALSNNDKFTFPNARHSKDGKEVLISSGHPSGKLTLAEVKDHIENVWLEIREG